jgi:hypothetical protein
MSPKASAPNGSGKDDFKAKYDALLADYNILKENEAVLEENGMRLAWRDPKKLKHREHNSKKHGKADLEGLYASVKKFGWKDIVLIEEDDTVIAGEGRDLVAIQIDKPRIPVIICTDLDKAQASAYSIAHNVTSRNSKFNDGAITQVFSELKAEGFDLEPLRPLKIDKWLEPLSDLPEFNLDTLEPKKVEELDRSDVPDCVWPTDNVWEVPVLNLKWQADALDLPVVQWGDISHKTQFTGVYHYYCEDDKFESLWKDPTGPLASGCISCVEANFSNYDQMSLAYVMGKIYQKRWISVYWQRQGKRIFVDLNVNEKFFKAPDGGDLCLLGVPSGWKSYFSRGYAKFPEKNIPQFELACEKAGTDDIIFVLYGGGKEIHDLCMKRGWQWVQDRRAMNREEWTKLFDAQNKANKGAGRAKG